jgi:starvation-inducible DNA-binding protein
MGRALKARQGVKKEKLLPEIRIGIGDRERGRLGEGLAALLADTYVLYTKSQNFHWNVTGPFFPGLHALFEKQYQELALANDEIAERIRALGFFAMASCAQFRRLSLIRESEGVPDAISMVQELVKGNEAALRTGRGLVPLAAASGDHGTADLVTRRLEAHEKAAWMLRSFLNP